MSTIDMGALLVEDSRCTVGMDEKGIMLNTKQNLCKLYDQLYDLKKKQRAEDGGEDNEILEYTKSKYSVKLPDSKLVLPR